MQRLSYQGDLAMVGYVGQLCEDEDHNIVIRYRQEGRTDVGELRILPHQADKLQCWLGAFIKRRGEEQIPKKLVRVVFTRPETCGDLRHTTYFADKRQTATELQRALEALWPDAQLQQATHDITPRESPCSVGETS